MAMTDSEEKANDAIKIAPHLHTVIFENDEVRVLKVIVPPGENAEMHWHPQNINYILASGKMRVTKLDGSIIDVDLEVGKVTSAGAGSHAVSNIGETTIETVQVELKS